MRNRALTGRRLATDSNEAQKTTIQGTEIPKEIPWHSMQHFWTKNQNNPSTGYNGRGPTGSS